MSTVVNTHELTGRVLFKRTGVAVGDKGMKKNFLIVGAQYMRKGAPQEQHIKCVCFSWENNKSKIDDVLPGDEVAFSFSISGIMRDEKKDMYGLPSCWNEAIIESSLTILNTSQRTLYANEPTKDGMGVFPEAKVKYTDGEASIPGVDDESGDLPF